MHANSIGSTITAKQQKEGFPVRVKPMLSTLVDKPFDSKEWVFVVKWDGVHSILLFHKLKTILELQSRSGKSITHRYPTITGRIFRCSDCSTTIWTGDITDSTSNI
jgi:bifunctional non-homologous end joining protein LigD